MIALIVMDLNDGPDGGIRLQVTDPYILVMLSIVIVTMIVQGSVGMNVPTVGRMVMVGIVGFNKTWPGFMAVMTPFFMTFMVAGILVMAMIVRIQNVGRR